MGAPITTRTSWPLPVVVAAARAIRVDPVPVIPHRRRRDCPLATIVCHRIVDKIQPIQPIIVFTGKRIIVPAQDDF